jgi:hypothetical protein
METAPAQTQSAQARVYPPIKQLLKESWDNLVAKILPILIFNSILIGIIVVAFIILFLLLAGSVSLSNLPALASNALLTSAPVLLILLVWILVMVVLLSLFHVGNVYILSSNTAQVPYKGLLKQSLSVILPVFLGSLITGILVLGGTFLFVIPGIIFALYLLFTTYLIILDRLPVMEALRRSVFLVHNSFGQIFVRIVVLILIPIVFNTVLGLFSNSDSQSMLSSLFSIFYSFFSISYMLGLFKQVKAISGQGTSSLKYIVISSVAGWILALITFTLGYRAISSLINTSQTAPLPINTNLPTDFDEEFLLDDEFLLSTPSATPVVRVSPTPIPSLAPARVSTPSAVNP